MTLVTANFSLEEFACKDGTVYPGEWVHDRLLPLCLELEKIRTMFNAPIHINSGFRTEAYNKKIGGEKNSFHKSGMAADIVVAGVDARHVHLEILDAVRHGRLEIGGLGSYPTFCHVDIRKWDHLAYWYKN